MTKDQIAASIGAYFGGERAEAFTLLIVSAVLALAGLAFLLRVRDGFAYAFGGALIVGALLLAITGGTILVRDPGLASALLENLGSATREPPALTSEQARIAKVLGDFKVYTWTFLVLGAAGFALLVLGTHPPLRGIAAGLLVLLAAQTVIDHYGEERARIYASELSRYLKR